MNLAFTKNPLALAVLEGTFPPGSTILAEREGDHLRFQLDGVPAGTAQGA